MKNHALNMLVGSIANAAGASRLSPVNYVAISKHDTHTSVNVQVATDADVDAVALEIMASDEAAAGAVMKTPPQEHETETLTWRRAEVCIGELHISIIGPMRQIAAAAEVAA